MNLKLLLRRLLAFVIDWNIMFGVGIGFMLFGPGVKPEYALRPSIEMFSSLGFVIGICWIPLYALLKDCLFNRRSLGKLLCGLKIDCYNSDKTPSYISLILRNITFIFVQIEIIVNLVNKGRRLGDMLAKTEVTGLKR